MHVFAHLADHRFRRGDADALAQADDPSEELRADAGLHPGHEPALAGGHDPDVLAEPVDQHAGHAVFALQRHRHALAAEHAEQPLGVVGHVEFPEPLAAVAGLAGHGDAQHLVHAEMLDAVVRGVVGDQVVIFVVPRQAPGAQLVPRAVAAQLHFAGDVPLEILEPDLRIGIDGLVQLVHVVIDALVHGLHAPGDHHLPVQLAGLVPADQPLQLADQVPRLAVGDELRRLHRIHQQLQLRQLEFPGAEVIIRVPPALFADDVQAEAPQLLEIQVQRLAVGVHIVGGQLFGDLLQRQRVVLVRLLGEDPRQVQHLQFLVVSLGHVRPPRISRARRAFRPRSAP